MVEALETALVSSELQCSSQTKLKDSTAEESATQCSSFNNTKEQLEESVRLWTQDELRENIIQQGVEVYQKLGQDVEGNTWSERFQ